MIRHRRPYGRLHGEDYRPSRRRRDLNKRSSFDEEVDDEYKMLRKAEREVFAYIDRHDMKGFSLKDKQVMDIVKQVKDEKIKHKVIRDTAREILSRELLQQLGFSVNYAQALVTLLLVYISFGGISSGDRRLFPQEGHFSVRKRGEYFINLLEREYIEGWIESKPYLKKWTRLMSRMIDTQEVLHVRDLEKLGDEIVESILDYY